MIAFLVGPAMGLGGVALMLTLVEGLALTVVIAALAERYLFPMS